MVNIEENSGRTKLCIVYAKKTQKKCSEQCSIEGAVASTIQYSRVEAVARSPEKAWVSWQVEQAVARGTTKQPQLTHKKHFRKHTEKGFLHKTCYLKAKK